MDANSPTRRIADSRPPVFETRPDATEIKERLRQAEKTVNELLKLVAPRCEEIIDGPKSPSDTSTVMRETRRLALEMFENLRAMERLFGMPENFASALERIGRSVSTSMSKSAPELRRFQMISESLELLREHLGMDYAGIWLIREGGDVPLHESGSLHPSCEMDTVREQIEAAIEGTKDGRFAFLDPSDSEGGGVDAVFIFRNIEGKPVGYLLLDDYDTAHDIDMETIRQVAETYYLQLHAAIHEEESAMAKKELLDIQRELERMRNELHNNRFDQLTGVLRKDAAEGTMSNVIERIRRSPAEASAVLCIFDIDHFKRVNDTYGHLMGNEVLSKMGEVLAGKCGGYSPRKIDTICRWGGEEFVILFDETDEKGARSATNRIASALKALKFRDAESGVEFGITVTTGLVGIRTSELRELPLDTDVLAHYFHLADKCLYYGKRAGRDIVVTFEPGVTDPKNLPTEPGADADDGEIAAYEAGIAAIRERAGADPIRK